jgi:glycogen synthase
MVKRRTNNLKLVIIGSYNLKNDVFILTNVSEERKWIILSQAKMIVHAKRFEPFGIAVAEGMVAGAIPVVYKGPASGSWIDVVDKGRYGIGFRTIEEFAESIEYIMNADGTELSELQEKAYKGSQRFSFDKFERNITRLLK